MQGGRPNEAPSGGWWRTDAADVAIFGFRDSAVRGTLLGLKLRSEVTSPHGLQKPLQITSRGSQAGIRRGTPKMNAAGFEPLHPFSRVLAERNTRCTIGAPPTKLRPHNAKPEQGHKIARMQTGSPARIHSHAA